MLLFKNNTCDMNSRNTFSYNFFHRQGTGVFLLCFVTSALSEAPLPDRNYLPPSTSYGTPDLGSNEVSAPSVSYGAPSTSYDPPPAGKGLTHDLNKGSIQ